MSSSRRSSTPGQDDGSAGPPREKAAPPLIVRRIGCVSTGRADAGIYRPLLARLAREGGRRVFCFAGGTHLSAAFGRTIEELRDIAGVEIVPVDHQVAGDGPEAVAATAGRATEAFSGIFARYGVDLLFVLGDRTEMLAAALAGVIHRLPIAHLHGGERTEGAYDDVCRDAITKLAHLHFTALPEYAERIRALGEEAWRIHTIGAPALDALAEFRAESLDTLHAALGFDAGRPLYVVIFHPETLGRQTPRQQVDALLAALRETEANLLIVGTNADVGHAEIDRAMAAFAADPPRVRRIPSLPHRRFWSCLAHAEVLIGNSSAGIIEAPSFRLPVVNIGGRQAGRVRMANVLDVPAESAEILGAIRRATSAAFREGLRSMDNRYHAGSAAERIVEVLGRLPGRERLAKKRGPV